MERTTVSLTGGTISLLFGDQEDMEIEVEDPDNTQILLKAPVADPNQFAIETRARLLVNQDRSFWIEQKDASVSAEIRKSDGSQVSRLVKDQVARLESGDLIGFGGNFVRFNLEGNTVVLSGMKSRKP